MIQMCWKLIIEFIWRTNGRKRRRVALRYSNKPLVKRFSLQIFVATEFSKLSESKFFPETKEDVTNIYRHLLRKSIRIDFVLLNFACWTFRWRWGTNFRITVNSNRVWLCRVDTMSSSMRLKNTRRPLGSCST